VRDSREEDRIGRSNGIITGFERANGGSGWGQEDVTVIRNFDKDCPERKETIERGWCALVRFMTASDGQETTTSFLKLAKANI